jgi:DNA-binding XRE family transcriptional regulator
MEASSHCDRPLAERNSLSLFLNPFGYFMGSLYESRRMLSILMDAFIVRGYMNNELGEKIRLARNSLGMTQEKLAENVGCERLAVQRWELGQRIPRADNLALIARTLNRPVGWFFGESHTGSRLKWGREQANLTTEELSDRIFR